MATKLEIANRAILELGGTPLTADEFSGAVLSGTGKIAAPAVDTAILKALADHDWYINRRTLEVPGVDSTSPDPSYAKQHDLSTLTGTVVQLRLILDSSGCRVTDYRREGNLLFTDHDTVYVRYSYEVTDPEDLPQYLVDLVVAHAIHEMAYAVTASEERKNTYLNALKMTLSEAKVRAAREEPPRSYMTDGQSRFISAHSGDDHYERSDSGLEVDTNYAGDRPPL